MRPHAEDPYDSLVCNTAFFELSLDDLINEAMLTIDAPRIHALQAANQRLEGGRIFRIKFTNRLDDKGYFSDADICGGSDQSHVQIYTKAP